jgi:hypothetical protein
MIRTQNIEKLNSCCLRNLNFCYLYSISNFVQLLRRGPEANVKSLRLLTVGVTSWQNGGLQKQSVILSQTDPLSSVIDVNRNEQRLNP